MAYSKHLMDKGYFIATELPDGSPGIPVGNGEAIMMFEDVGVAKKVRDDLSISEKKVLQIFAMNMTFCGKVVL